MAGMSRKGSSEVKRFDGRGASHRRADYLVLRVLEASGRCVQTKLEERCMNVVDRLRMEDVSTPIHFRRSSGSNGVHSREFLGALDRGIRMGRIREAERGTYELTEKGAEFLDDDEKLNEYGILPEFRSKLDEVIELI